MFLISHVIIFSGLGSCLAARSPDLSISIRDINLTLKDFYTADPEQSF